MPQLYNTLSRKTEEFKPIKNKEVGMYACGPTVYDWAHIGNLRTYIFEDILRRVLEFQNYIVKHVMNITDVGHLVADSDTGEEKIEAAARKVGKSSWEIAAIYTNAFLADMQKLNILPPIVMPKATDHVADQIEIIKILEEKGYTYKTSDGIYFDTSKFPNYGKLAGQRLEEKEAGSRVEVNPEKKNSWDFALWKFSPTDHKREMEWESPWGTGFPGWHIECSAMSRKYLGQPFDIHAGGIDHVPIHHTNEIAQSEAAFDAPLANYWLHGEFLTVNDKRMGKSEGNLITVSEIEKRGFSPLAYRYFTLGAHYRSKLNFTWEALRAAQHALWNLEDLCRDFDEPKIGCAEFEKKFSDALEDDLNTPQALAVLWETVKSDYPTSAKARTLLTFDKILGLDLEKIVARPLEIPREVIELMESREKARENKEWAEADALREQIETSGFSVEDTASGPKISVKHGLGSR